jgi:anti-sigma regulatory factor (Ser/Thr protein kinase)
VNVVSDHLGPVSREVPPDLAELAEARAWVVDTIRRWGLPLSREAIQDVKLCASEVIANAIVHTGMRCTVSVTWSGRRVRVEVADNSLRLPQYGNAHDPEVRGRGLYLVRELSWDLGCYLAAPGKVVWFEFGSHAVPAQDNRLAAIVRVAHARLMANAAVP